VGLLKPRQQRQASRIAAMNASWPTSTPMLNPNNAIGISTAGGSSAFSPPAKPPSLVASVRRERFVEPAKGNAKG